MIVTIIMRVGFDLDNVFISNPPIIPHRIVERLYRKKTNGDLEYRMPKRFEQYIRKASHAPLLRPAIKNNLSVLRSISKDKHTLFLISSRFGFLKQATNKIIKKHKLDQIFSEMYFNFDNKQPHLFKEETIKRLRLDTFIDDDLPLLKFLASRNNAIKLYWLNRKIDKKISANITAITKLERIFE